MNSNKNINYLNTECSPSHLFGNLTMSDKSIMYIHNSESLPRIIIVDRKLMDNPETENLNQFVSKLNSTETSEMLVVKCLNINNTYYVAVGLYGGFKLWSSDGNRLLFNIPAKVRTTDKPYAFTSICEFKSNKDLSYSDSIICTDNYGQVFQVTGSGQVWKAKMLYSYDGVTITCVCAKDQLICVGFESSEVFIFRFKNDGQVEVAAKLGNIYNLPSLSMGIITENNKNVLVIGYLNGEIILHNLENNFEMNSTLGGHLRLITHITTYKNIFISSGDDSFVNIWKLDEKDNITNIGNYEFKDRMPIGTCLYEKDGKFNLLVSFYDYTTLGIIEDLKL